MLEATGMGAERTTAKVIDARIDALSWDAALARIENWGKARESRYVCICNVHSVVTASKDAAFRLVVDDADMATPDGAPVAWMLRRLGFSHQTRINGPDLMWRYCVMAAKTGQKMFFYGGTERTLDLLRERLSKQFPSLQIVGSYSPPFRALTEQEDTWICDQINMSGANVVWVSLGCPKQEFWMASHRGYINAVMVGVGAAFDYHAGVIPRAPLWMQNAGLEWVHRLFSEPRRLWRRYLFTNSFFVFFVFRRFLTDLGGRWRRRRRVDCE